MAVRWTGGRARAIAGLAALPHLCFATLLMVASPGHAQTPGASFDDEGLAKQMLEMHIRPGYDLFVKKSTELKSTLEAACKARDAKDGDKIRGAFRETVLAWSRVEHLHFGPVIENNRGERIMFWPDRQNIGDRQMSQIIEKRDPTALTAADLQKKSAAVQGLTALEVLLYGKPAAGLLADTPDGQFSCGYATAIGANMAAIGQEIVAAWATGGDFANVWLKPGEQNALYKSRGATSLELLKAYRVGLNNIRDNKLLGPLGLRKLQGGGLVPKSRPPFDLSGLSLATIVANAEGVLDQFEKGGFALRMNFDNPNSVAMIQTELQKAIKIGREAEAAGTSAFADGPAAKIAALREPLNLAAKLGGDDLEMTVTGKVLGFTDGDGD